MPKNNKYRQIKKTAAAAVNETSAPASLRNAPVAFNPDYSPVIRDLKRIGILAGSFIAILIVLSFIIK